MPTKAKIHGSEQPIVKVFSSDYSYVIPNYQRPYSWTKDQARQLIDDLSYFAFQEKTFDDLRPYFLGSVVLIKEDDLPTAKVIDGQQRLTTLTILLSALRDLLPTQKEKDEITEIIYEKGSEIRGTKDKFRLTLRSRDQEFFNTFIQHPDGIAKLTAGMPLPDSQSRIRDNAVFLKAYITANYNQERQKRLVTFLVQKCFLVVVSTTDEDSAYRIFSVLNDRGLQLSHADILKADIIGSIPENEQDSYTKKWEDCEDDLGTEGFKDLFAHVRMIYRKAKQRDTILKEIRDYVKPSNKPKDFVDLVLIPLADAFGAVKKAAFDSGTKFIEINRTLQWLNQIDNEDWMPPAISFIAKTSKQEPDVVSTFLPRLETLAFGLFVLRSDVNDRIERYAKVLSEIEGGKDFTSKDSALSLTGEEKVKIKKAIGEEVYGTKYAKYLLLRIDEFMSAGGAVYDLPIVSIEHVLPQSPEPNGEWTKLFKEGERKELTNYLGNLVLLSRRKNSAAQNFEFEKKKQKYFVQKGVTPFAMTTDVLNYKLWTPDTVRERQKRLLAHCCKIWTLE
jgi:uncharacterized protein with ParB-like and HNH nuclease domain